MGKALVNQTFPQNQVGLSHAKRVRRVEEQLQVLLVPVSYMSIEELDPYLKEWGFTHVQTIEIPDKAPLLKRQLNEWKSLWPISFHKTHDYELSDSDSAIAKEWIQQLDHQVFIVHPKTNALLASANSESHQHPLHHAVMVAIAKVAKQEQEQRSIGIKRKEDLGYLCTGYDVYLQSEPCVMCAMALLHSRIRRLFFTSKSASSGPFSHYRLHHKKQLNHRFNVYEVINPSTLPMY